MSNTIRLLCLFVIITATHSRFHFFTQLTANDALPGDEFGRAVSISNTTFVVGARADDNENGNDAGAAYIFSLMSNSWTQTKIIAPGGQAMDRFGASVAMQENIIVVGAPLQGASDFGAAYVFIRTDPSLPLNWTFAQKLTAPDESLLTSFGESVAIDGNRILVGAFKHAGDGAAYIFVYNSSTRIWDFEASFKGNNGVNDQRFGNAVALSGDSLAIGSNRDRSAVFRGGAVYMYIFINDVWTFQQKLFIPSAASSDYFGWSIAMRGNTMVVGAVFDNVGSASDSGSAWVYEKNGTFGWNLLQQLTVSDPNAGDRFGVSCSLTEKHIVVGAYYVDNGLITNSGASYIFDKGSSVWFQSQKIERNPTASQFLGWAVAVDENWSVVTAYGESLSAGAVYVFDFQAPTVSPTRNPTKNPTRNPTANPTRNPSTTAPSGFPTGIPSVQPTWAPTGIPTMTPTTSIPTNAPTGVPSSLPTSAPSNTPTQYPSTSVPTQFPSTVPSHHPTDVPTESPTDTPSFIPTTLPTDIPTNIPSQLPSSAPTALPSLQPTQSPTHIPSKIPTNPPRNQTTPITNQAFNFPQRILAGDPMTIGIASSGIFVFCCVICLCFYTCMRVVARDRGVKETDSLPPLAQLRPASNPEMEAVTIVMGTYSPEIKKWLDDIQLGKLYEPFMLNGLTSTEQVMRVSDADLTRMNVNEMEREWVLKHVHMLGQKEGDGGHRREISKSPTPASGLYEVPEMSESGEGMMMTTTPRTPMRHNRSDAFPEEKGDTDGQMVDESDDTEDENDDDDEIENDDDEDSG